MPGHVPAAARADSDGGAEWAGAGWGCGVAGGVADGWLPTRPLEAEEEGGWTGEGAGGGGAWRVGPLDLPPFGEPGEAWATFETLLPPP